ncbi:septum site-determining protein MinC [Candidatus Erwinia haradaeae]|uniref:Probable septum site-determining protein MinC n=1 Tax=Candidatus Erwinia haradaeae TaxID=1922217 RepID=A0A451DHM3_9GAMM|nr:septum site-determining protein MinC [Candidatus Erwinia haradaeae]VFP86147.1 Septum site-determining protein MinC [Candidatus Erwinia haradaeae]
MSQLPIDLKGSSFTLPVLHLRHTDPSIIQKALKEKISRAPNFFNNAAVIVNVSILTKEVNWYQIKKAILSTGIFIVGISGCQDEQLKDIIIRSGLPVLNSSQVHTSIKESVTPAKLFTKTRIIFSPIRSGQQVYAANADLVIINSVSEGAEVLADGNIHVYGVMRGRALAGASGDDSCQIFCTSLFAELVSISGHYWIMEQIPNDSIGCASRLYLQDGILTIQKLN